MLLEWRLWASAFEMVPTPGKRAVSFGRRSAETVLEGKSRSRFSQVVIVDHLKTRRAALINDKLVTAIGLTSLIYLACLILAGVIYWSCRTGNLAGFANAKRTVLAMYRAAEAGLLRGARSAALPLVAALGLWVLARSLFADAGLTQRAVLGSSYVILATVAGGVSALLLSFIAVQWARVSALRTIAGSIASADRLLSVVFRSSAALALLVEASGFLVSLGIAGLCWVTRSEAGGSTGAAPQILLATTQVLSDYAIGAILVTFAIQASGTTYRICSRAGSAVATRDGNLAEQDPRNPSTIADAAGTQLGHLVPSTLDAFCTSLCSNALLLFLLWSLRSSDSGAFPASYLLLPLVLRAFGALATLFAVASIRTLESQNPSAALLRSEAVLVVIVLGAIGGACTWLVPDQLARLALCAAIGFLLPLALGHWQTFIVSRAVQRAKSPRALSDGSWSSGLPIALLALSAPLLLLVGVLLCVVQLGVSSGLGHGRWLALMACYLGMGIAVPFCVTIDAAAPLVSLSRRAVHLIDSLRVDDGQRRLARLEEATYSTTMHAMSSQTQTASGLPVLTALAVGMIAHTTATVPAVSEALSTLYIGPMTLLIPLGAIVQASLHASRALSNEVRRQIGGFPLGAGTFRVPADFTPSYRNCVDVASRESTRKLGLPSVAFVIVPLVYGALVSRALHNTGPAGQTLALYVGMVAVSVVVVGFVLEAASDFANQVCVRAPRAASSQHPLAFSDAVQHLAMHATPAVRLLAKATVIVALTYTPYVL